MKLSNPAQRQRETTVLVVLVLLFGGGIVLSLLLLTGWLFVAVVGTLLVGALAAGLHYLIWGRSMTSQVTREWQDDPWAQRVDQPRQPLGSSPRRDLNGNSMSGGDLG